MDNYLNEQKKICEEEDYYLYFLSFQNYFNNIYNNYIDLKDDIKVTELLENLNIHYNTRKHVLKFKELYYTCIILNNENNLILYTGKDIFEICLHTNLIKIYCKKLNISCIITKNKDKYEYIHYIAINNENNCENILDIKLFIKEEICLLSINKDKYISTLNLTTFEPYNRKKNKPFVFTSNNGIKLPIQFEGKQTLFREGYYCFTILNKQEKQEDDNEIINNLIIKNILNQDKNIKILMVENMFELSDNYNNCEQNVKLNFKVIDNNKITININKDKYFNTIDFIKLFTDYIFEANEYIKNVYYIFK
jgi:hypothetical protein